MGQPRPSAQTLRHTPDFVAPATIFDLLNYSIFELLSVTASLVTRICEADYHVTREEWQIVAMLHALGPASPTELAASTTLDPSQMSRTLRSMRDKGLVQRQPVAGDRRRALIVLGVEGQALHTSLFPRVVELHHRLLAGFDDTTRRALADTLHRLHINALDAYRDASPSAKVDRRKTRPGHRAHVPAR